MKMTTIALKMETKEKLKEIGSKGETYDELINKLIEIAEKSYFLKRQKKILGEKFVKLKEI
ncbi:MAG: hypothetical protein J7K22_04015 [Nanoarchaeota archaeon]|nr:hypothetical protein [Nanoarchaeota archaeon]